MSSSSPPSEAAADDCRCLCGSLLARVVDGQVELKCRRCKRTLRVPIEPGRSPEFVSADPVRRAV